MMLDHQRLLELVTPYLDQQKQAGAPISLAICDGHGDLMFFWRMPGAALHSGVLAQNKAYTAARDRQSTLALGEWSRQSGRTLAYWSDPRFTGFAGGVPLWLQGQVRGAVGISGLSEEQDHAVASELATALAATLAN